jgi:hypothetical protein
MSGIVVAAAIGLAVGVCTGWLAGVASGWYLFRDAAQEPAPVEPMALDLDVPANRERLEKWLRADLLISDGCDWSGVIAKLFAKSMRPTRKAG